VVENATLYRVDGEIGRITFPTYAVQQDKQILWNSVPKVFGAPGVLRYPIREGTTSRFLQFFVLSDDRPGL